MSHQWTPAERDAAVLPWKTFHAQYPALTPAQWRYARQVQRKRPDRRVSRNWVSRGPETSAERQVARKLAWLASRARVMPCRANGDQILSALQEWWRETRGAL